MRVTYQSTILSSSLGVACGFQRSDRIHILFCVSLKSLDECGAPISSLPGGINLVGIVRTLQNGDSRSEFVPLMSKLGVDLFIEPLSRLPVYCLKGGDFSPVKATFEVHEIINHVSRIPLVMRCHRSKVQEQLNNWFVSNVHIQSSARESCTHPLVQVHEAQVRLHDWKGRYMGNDPVSISGYVTLVCITSKEFDDLTSGMKESLLRSCEDGDLRGDKSVFFSLVGNERILMKIRDPIKHVLEASGFSFEKWKDPRFNPSIDADAAAKPSRLCKHPGIRLLATVAVVLVSIAIRFLIRVLK